ncbi:hypothetical protein chiPu_0011803 [Chiloscyllium punctatum]|uniref:SHSP domain-containing protein n=1 Tax=Chiloscyllium punctatum TaxID=137246 RepID=A0A401SSE9_CHIPU|nr:hypothetical protein [Chiloscyllium punctatum]
MTDLRASAGKAKFSLSLNLAGTDPQKVRVSIAGRKLNVSGEQFQKVREDSGLSRYNYCGFSNDLSLAPNLDLTTVMATIIDERVITIEASYYADPSLASRVEDELDPRKIPVFLKYTPAYSSSSRRFNFIWTPCFVPIPGSRHEGGSNQLIQRCRHSIPGTICNTTLVSPSQMHNTKDL